MDADPRLYLSTSFVLDGRGRALWTREPGACRAPLFSLVRSATSVAWVVGAGVPADVAVAIDRLARLEPPVRDLRVAPEHAGRYRGLLFGRDAPGMQTMPAIVETSSPAFTFPESVEPPVGIVRVTDERRVGRLGVGAICDRFAERWRPRRRRARL